MIPAVFVIPVRERGGRTEVLLQRRRGTGFMDGFWACGAAGHGEPGEPLQVGAAREAQEELGIRVADPDADLDPLVTQLLTSVLDTPDAEYLNVYFTLSDWSGEPEVREPALCEQIAWFPVDDLPDRVVPHERDALERLAAGERGRVLNRGFDQRLTLIAAVSRDGVIGDGAGMPWHLPEDLAFFKRATMGAVLLMGRGTWDSIGRALPGRRTIVLTRDPDWSAPGAEVAASLAEALHLAGDGEVFSAGGGEVYRQTLDLADRLLITHVDREVEGSVTFPRIDPEQWHETERTPGDGLAWVTYARANPR